MPAYRQPPGRCELLIGGVGVGRGRSAAAEAVGQAQDEMVGPHVGFEGSASFQVGLVAREAELIVPEHRDARADTIFETDQAFDRNPRDLIFESPDAASRPPDLHMGEAKPTPSPT